MGGNAQRGVNMGKMKSMSIVKFDNQERQFLASLPADVRAQLGLLCTCCGTCKTGQKAHPAEATTTAAPTTASRAERSAIVDAERLANGLARSEAMALASAADAECLFY